MAVLSLVGVGSASAVPYGTTQAVDGVKVNKTGGVTAWGTVDCTAEVAAYFAPGAIPANTVVLTNESWVARQSVGRKTVLQATYESNYANPCFDNRVGAGDGPYPWMTSQFNSTDTPYYVYSPNGVFKTGMIHVDLKSEGGILEVDGQFVADLGIFQLTGFDLRATRA
jgi:hypothetical protein